MLVYRDERVKQALLNVSGLKTVTVQDIFHPHLGALLELISIVVVCQRQTFPVECLQQTLQVVFQQNLRSLTGFLLLIIPLLN